jgi:hypothetical protein
MRACTCDKPCPSPNPRREGRCNRCQGLMQPRITQSHISLSCVRCRHRFNPDTEGRAGIYIDRGGAGPEKLKLQEVVNLCGSCAEDLRSYLGMAPDQLYRE